MLIQNFDSLASGNIRKQALEIVEAGLESLLPEKVVAKNLQLEGTSLIVQGKRYDLSSFERVIIGGIGKAAWGVVEQLAGLLGERVSNGLVLGTKDEKVGAVVCREASHPLPSARNVELTQELVQMLEDTSEKDFVVMVITGGGSAMMSWPEGVSLEQLQEVNQKLLESGATIGEVNVVRKHLSAVKGGKLAQRIGAGKVIALVMSDVEGDDLGTIASGPLTLDTSTIEDAIQISDRYQLETKLGFEIVWQETPKDQELFEKIEHYLLASNAMAVAAMAEKAREYGKKVRVLDEYVHGEAREVGKRLVAEVGEGEIVVGGGETTVTVVGDGRGGRNQELVLGGLRGIEKGIVLVSVASDGRDLTEAAGALGDELVRERARELGLDVDRYLEENNSAEFFDKVGSRIVTGKLPANVADLVVVIRSQSGDRGRV